MVRLARGQSAEAVGFMTLGLLHDFNNVLTVIQCSTRKLRPDLSNNATAVHCLDAITLAAQQGAAVCHEVLARFQGDAYQSAAVDLGALVASMMPLLEQLVGPKAAVNHRRISGPAPVCVNRAQVERVVMNLVMNAKDSLGTAGHIAIETRSVGRDETASELEVTLADRAFGVLTVTDDGCGMDAATQARIFEDFFSTKAHGTGFGLSIVMGAVQDAGGAIAVDSAPGLGSSFRIYIPASAGIQPCTVGDTDAQRSSHSAT